MKQLFLKLELLIAAVFLLTACDNDNESATRFKIENLTTANFPKVDGSTSTLPLQVIMACKLLDIRYEWMPNLAMDGVYFVMPSLEDDPDRFILNNITHHGTHEAFMNLIDKECDFILVAREASSDEIEHARESGVRLIETPVALDAFIFITHRDNPVKTLTTKQIQDIYTGKITNWKEVGGKDAAINPYVRNANSGSQELMESLVMQDLEMSDFPEAMLTGMMGPFITLRTDVDGLCYTVYYFKEKLVRGDLVKHIAVDGVYPDQSSIKKKSYPYATEVYAVIREDTDKDSMAGKLYDLLLTPSGKKVIEESEYIPY